MGFYCKCPSCGHQHRLAKDWLGKEIKCMACADLFPVSAHITRAEAPSEPTPRASKTPRRDVLRRIRRILGDPSAALDAATPGAISGILAGVQGALLAGIVSGQTAGEIIGRILIGFVIGFGVGTALGAIAGAAMKRIRPDFHIEPGGAALIGGALIGIIVVVIVENFRWMLLGAPIGAVGADLWLILNSRVESASRLAGELPSEKRLDKNEGGPHSRHFIQTNAHSATEADALRKSNTPTPKHR